jgi:hypothetical protein
MCRVFPFIYLLREKIKKFFSLNNASININVLANVLASVFCKLKFTHSITQLKISLINLLFMQIENTYFKSKKINFIK